MGTFIQGEASPPNTPAFTDLVTSGMLHHPGASLSECLIKSNPV